jgi:hypothetical protein
MRYVRGGWWLSLLALLGLGLWGRPALAAEPVSDAERSRIVGDLNKRAEEFEILTSELDLAAAPDDLMGRTLAANRLDTLGQWLVEASRRVAALHDGDELAALRQELARFDSDLWEAYRKTRLVAIWSLQHRDGVRRPNWGVGVARGDEPVYRELERLEVYVRSPLKLSAAPGQKATGQAVVVSLKDDLLGVRARATGAFSGPGGRIPLAAVRVEPVLWKAGVTPEAAPTVTPLKVGPVTVPYGRVQPFMVTVDLSAQTKPGVYTAQLSLTAEKRATVRLDLELTVVGSGRDGT